MEKNYTYKKEQNILLDQEFQNADQYGKVKLADHTLFWKKGFGWSFVKIEDIKKAFRRIEAVDTKMCCGSVNFDIQKLVLILKDDTKLELLIGDGMPREAEALFEKLKGMDTDIQFGK